MKVSLHIYKKHHMIWISLCAFSFTVQQTNLSHPFHLHGTSFHVIGMGRSPDTNVNKINLKHALEWDRKGLLHRQFAKPPLKDTVAVPNNGYVVLRFRADNPGHFQEWEKNHISIVQFIYFFLQSFCFAGFWLFHCHFQFHIVIGMNLVIHIGTQADLPPVPPNFPKCGHHLPPIKHH